MACFGSLANSHGVDLLKKSIITQEMNIIPNSHGRPYFTEWKVSARPRTRPRARRKISRGQISRGRARGRAEIFFFQIQYFDCIWDLLLMLGLVLGLEVVIRCWPGGWDWE